MSSLSKASIASSFARLLRRRRTDDRAFKQARKAAKQWAAPKPRVDTEPALPARSRAPVIVEVVGLDNQQVPSPSPRDLKDLPIGAGYSDSLLHQLRLPVAETDRTQVSYMMTSTMDPKSSPRGSKSLAGDINSRFRDRHSTHVRGSTRSESRQTLVPTEDGRSTIHRSEDSVTSHRRRPTFWRTWNPYWSTVNAQNPTPLEDAHISSVNIPSSSTSARPVMPKRAYTTGLEDQVDRCRSLPARSSPDISLVDSNVATRPAPMTSNSMHNLFSTRLLNYPPALRSHGRSPGSITTVSASSSPLVSESRGMSVQSRSRRPSYFTRYLHRSHDGSQLLDTPISESIQRQSGGGSAHSLIRQTNEGPHLPRNRARFRRSSRGSVLPGSRLGVTSPIRIPLSDQQSDIPSSPLGHRKQ